MGYHQELSRRIWNSADLMAIILAIGLCVWPLVHAHHAAAGIGVSGDYLAGINQEKWKEYEISRQQ